MNICNMYGQEYKEDRNAFLKVAVENSWINVTNIGASETNFCKHELMFPATATVCGERTFSYQ